MNDWSGPFADRMQRNFSVILKLIIALDQRYAQYAPDIPWKKKLAPPIKKAHTKNQKTKQKTSNFYRMEY